LSKLLEAGELDLAVLATDSPRKEDVILGRENIVWVGSWNHDLHIQRPLRLALFSDESPIYRATIASLSKFEVKDGKSTEVEIALRSSSWSVLTTAASAGYAIATMAQSVVVPSLRVLGSDFGFPDLGHVFLVMRRTADSQSIATSRLSEEILEGFRSDAPLSSIAEPGQGDEVLIAIDAGLKGRESRL
jgi:DNA-binding transcriptional LysR family regulator